MKIDLKTILTLLFACAVIVLTFMKFIEPEVAVVPAFLSVITYYFAKKDTPSV